MGHTQEPLDIPLTGIVIAHQTNDAVVRAVASISWMPEILFVWTSESKVPSFTREYPQLKVIKEPGVVQDFAKLRNLALQQASQPWVFFLDSDEALADSAKKELPKLLKNLDIAAFSLQRRDIFLDKELRWGEVRNVRVIRLMQKDLARYVRPVHEIVEVTGEIGKAESLIYHYAHASISSFLNKINHYTQLEAQLRQSTPRIHAVWQLLILPIGKFWWNYVFQLGFLDGWRGLIYAVMMSTHSLGVRALLYEKKSSTQ